MVESCWQIGRMIVEHEQHGNSRAEYGQQQLSQQLTERLDKGFDVTNLRNMRRFYFAFPIRETVSLELKGIDFSVPSATAAKKEKFLLSISPADNTLIVQISNLPDDFVGF